MKNDICIICGSSFLVERAMFYDKQPYCARHYMQLRLIGKIIRTYKDKNIINIKDNCAEILLTNGNSELEVFALIDLEDIEKVKDIYWGLTCENYARNSKIGFLHNFILNIDTKNSSNIVPDHINRNRLDCRKENLRIVSRT